jgi:hypothetical protein
MLVRPRHEVHDKKGVFRANPECRARFLGAAGSQKGQWEEDDESAHGEMVHG